MLVWPTNQCARKAQVIPFGPIAPIINNFETAVQAAKFYGLRQPTLGLILIQILTFVN